MSVHDSGLALFARRSAAGEQLVPGWEDMLCRTQLAIDVDARRLCEHLDWRTFGWQSVGFYGDHRQEYKDLATLLGFEAIEEDK